MASFRVAILPLWKYGPVFSMLRSEGTLNMYLSASRLVTLYRPGSEVSGHGFTTPIFWYMLPPRSAPAWQVWHPEASKVLKPAFSSAVRAVWSPFRNLSQRAGVISLRSNAPIALPILSYVTGFLSLGKAFRNASTYPGIDLRTAITCFADVMAISTGFSTGPLACSSTSGARPSQNFTKWRAAL